MLLNVLERILLLQILPKESNLVTLRIAMGLSNNLSFTEKEFKDFSIVQLENQTKWNPNINTDTEIEIGEKATDLIVDSLKKLNTENKLTAEHLTLCDKFKVEA